MRVVLSSLLAMMGIMFYCAAEEKSVPLPKEGAFVIPARPLLNGFLNDRSLWVRDKRLYCTVENYACCYRLPDGERVWELRMDEGGAFTKLDSSLVFRKGNNATLVDLSSGKILWSRSGFPSTGDFIEGGAWLVFGRDERNSILRLDRTTGTTVCDLPCSTGLLWKWRGVISGGKLIYCYMPKSPMIGCVDLSQCVSEWSYGIDSPWDAGRNADIFLTAHTFDRSALLLFTRHAMNRDLDSGYLRWAMDFAGDARAAVLGATYILIPRFALTDVPKDEEVRFAALDIRTGARTTVLLPRGFFLATGQRFLFVSGNKLVVLDQANALSKIGERELPETYSIGIMGQPEWISDDLFVLCRQVDDLLSVDVYRNVFRGDPKK